MLLPLWARVQSLVGGLRFHKPCSVAEKKQSDISARFWATVSPGRTSVCMAWGHGCPRLLSTLACRSSMIRQTFLEAVTLAGTQGRQVLRIVTSLALWQGPEGPEAQAEARRVGAHPDGVQACRAEAQEASCVLGR